MSLIPHTIFPRRMMDLNTWMDPMAPVISNMPTVGSLVKQLVAPSSLEVFDPFDELDTLMSQDIDWLNRPDFLMPMQPRVQQKYRITVDCPGFVPLRNAIKTDIKNNVLTVSGREETKAEGTDFHVNEFKKTYNLPDNVEADKMVSFMPYAGTLVIEMPLKETQGQLNKDLFPQIVDTKEGTKAVQMSFGVPKNIDPSKVHVSIKDRDLIVRADEKKKDKDSTSKIHYYKRCTLPANTDFDNLKVKWDNDKLALSAPLRTDMRKAVRNVPIERPMEITQ